MGKAVIGDIMTYEVNQETWTLSLGDWTYGESSDSKYYGATRASDFILQYLPVFAAVSGDDRWTKVYDSTNAIIDSMVDKYGTGLLPDFLIPDGKGGYQPAPTDRTAITAAVSRGASAWMRRTIRRRESAWMR